MNKQIHANHISPRKVGWLKLDPKSEDNVLLDAESVYKRVDSLGTVFRKNLEFFGIVPSYTEEKSVAYLTIGPFISLKSAKDHTDRYLHREGFVIYKSDVLRMRKEAQEYVKRSNNFRRR